MKIIGFELRCFIYMVYKGTFSFTILIKTKIYFAHRQTKSNLNTSPVQIVLSFIIQNYANLRNYYNFIIKLIIRKGHSSSPQPRLAWFSRNDIINRVVSRDVVDMLTQIETTSFPTKVNLSRWFCLSCCHHRQHLNGAHGKIYL